MPAKEAADNFQTAELRDDSRRQEVVVAVGDGNQHVHHATIYGYDGASSEAEKYRLNEDLIGRSILRMFEVGQTPYFISGDFNIDPAESNIMKAMVQKGLVIDVPAAHLMHEQPTFHRKGPMEGVQGKGMTRIHIVLMNAAG